MAYVTPIATLQDALRALCAVQMVNAPLHAISHLHATTMEYVIKEKAAPAVTATDRAIAAPRDQFVNMECVQVCVAMDRSIPEKTV